MIYPITVITASYNSSKYLADAVESVAKQTIKPLRHIIIDDCSTDDSFALALLLKEKHSHVSVLINNQNKGFPATLNIGIREARTDYVAILDADDIALPNWLELIYKNITVHPDVGLIGGGCYILTEDGLNTGFKKYCDYKGDVTELIRQGKYAILHPGSVIKREKLEQIGFYREDLKSLEDKNMMIDMALISKAVHVGEPLVLYRRLRSSESRKTEEFTRLVKSFFDKKIALLKSGIKFDETYRILSNDIENFKSVKRTKFLVSGEYEVEMANAFWYGKKYYLAIKYFYKAARSGYNIKKIARTIFRRLVLSKSISFIKVIKRKK